MAGSAFSAIGDFIGLLTGLNEKEDALFKDNLDICTAYFKKKKQGINIKNYMSKYGDFAQVNSNTFVNCGLEISGIERIHTYEHFDNNTLHKSKHDFHQ